MYLFIHIIIISWIIFLAIIYIGWQIISEYDQNKKKIHDYTNVTIIIPFRNEENNLAKLLKGLSYQSYPLDKIEIIFVNDHSTDNSLNILSKLLRENFKFPNVKLLNLPKDLKGKKHAIEYGIKKSLNDFVILTDADAVLNPKWVETVVFFYQNSQWPDVIIGPVDYTHKNSTIYKIFNLEFLSLIISGMALAQLKKPIYANSINLSFKKNLFDKNEDILNHKVTSGDDTFLIHFAKKNKKSILPLKNKNAIVYTHPPSTIGEFFKQRSRWASKTPFYEDIESILTSSFVFLVHISFIFLLILIIFFQKYELSILIIIKFLAELIFFKKTTQFFNKNFSIPIILLTQILYPFYILIASLMSFFAKIEWKERKI